MKWLWLLWNLLLLGFACRRPGEKLTPSPATDTPLPSATMTMTEMATAHVI